MPDASDDEVSRVLQLTGADRVVAELPRGVESTIGEAGGGLSSGQQTRLQLARAMLGGPRVLLLDEADAHVDDDSLESLRDAISSFAGTVVCATHSPELVNLADVVWRVEHGTVAVEPKTLNGRRHTVREPV